MTAPTNWPNPERPGEPMFPERAGWHVIAKCPRPARGRVFDNGVELLIWWDAYNRHWRYTPNGRSIDLKPSEDIISSKYVGPVLTPAQITEMLAAERERCAKACEAIQMPDFSGPKHWYNIGCDDCSNVIRNLGAAP